MAPAWAVPAVASMSVDLLSRRGQWPPMLWVGGGQGAGKTTLSWHLSRANDLPLHRVDLWAYNA
jgi:adenylylsulfate kinase-like enzyme